MTDIYTHDTHSDVYYSNRFFDSISEPKTSSLQERMLSIVDVPFVNGPERKFVNVGCTVLYEDKTKQKKKYSYKQQVPCPNQLRLRLCQNIHDALYDEDILNRPIVFLVTSPPHPAGNRPHTGVYIYIPNGSIYSVGYININFREELPPGAMVDFEHQYGAFCSPDMPLREEVPSVILWFGLLTYQMADRLEQEINRVTEIRFCTEQKTIASGEKVEVVGNIGKLQLNFVIPHRNYRDFNADQHLKYETTDYTIEPLRWNCRIWAIHILFGLSGLRYFWKDRKAVFGPRFNITNNGHNSFVSHTISQWWRARERNDREEILVEMSIMNHIFMEESEFNKEWNRYIDGGIRTEASYGRSDKMRKYLLNAKHLFDEWVSEQPGSKKGGERRVKNSRINSKGKSRKSRKSRK